MSTYKLSSQADEDLSRIYEYTIYNFGLRQARKYFKGLQDTLLEIANQPELHREVPHLYQGLYYYPYQSHALFFTFNNDELFVVRILGQSMDFRRHI